MRTHRILTKLRDFFFQMKSFNHWSSTGDEIKRLRGTLSPRVFMARCSVKRRDSVFRCRQCNCNEKESDLTKFDLSRTAWLRDRFVAVSQRHTTSEM